jgi:hypothetical protein
MEQNIETSVIETNVSVVKKRGRKKKIDILNNNNNNNNNIQPDIDTNNIDKCIKKRGRKPKGGKIIINPLLTPVVDNVNTNVILHLKCSLQDLLKHNNDIQHIVSDPVKYNPIAPPTIETYNSMSSSNYYQLSNDDEIVVQSAYNDNTNDLNNNFCKLCNQKQYNIMNHLNNDNLPSNNNKLDNIENAELIHKIKQLKHNLYNNNNNNYHKKSACFWCTYEYDNEPFYIPKQESNGELCGYGSFCRPECAVAFLFKENIDDSNKFDRYQLLNATYGKINGYKRNIKPASDPYYLLDKFYGNLSIQEYRKLLSNEYLLNVVEKPMTRVLPELHDDIDNSTDNIMSSNSLSGFKVKRQSEKQKGPSKSSIIKDKFGL